MSKIIYKKTEVSEEEYQALLEISHYTVSTNDSWGQSGRIHLCNPDEKYEYEYVIVE